MKDLSFLEKLLFSINSIIAVFLLLSYITPFIEPESFALLSVLSLAVPFLIIANVLFLIFWLLKVKKQLLLSLFVLLIGYTYVASFYKFSSSKNVDDDSNISIMNYNVRLFNLYNWIQEDGVQTKITDFINKEEPDIISFQEYNPHDSIFLPNYSYKFEELSGKRTKYGQAIYSKFPIVQSGSFEFPNTGNNAIYADIVKDLDTIRVYNVHLQSAGISAEVESLSNENSQRLVSRIASTFKTQQSQAETFVAHKQSSPYKLIVCGDFNNTAYSYVYKLIKGDLIDTFEEAGNGFGRTYNLKYFPLRIDFILADQSFEVNHFKTYDVELSDHYPILSKVRLR
jgi:endonuclease/exonuclease/phosphatase family metal-dependent hydrolase